MGIRWRSSRRSLENADATNQTDLAAMRSLLNSAEIKPNMVRDCNGASALSIASYFGKLEVMAEFIRYGADILSKDIQGNHSLTMAVYGKQPEALGFLLACLKRPDEADDKDDIISCVEDARNDASKESGRDHNRMISACDAWLQNNKSDPLLIQGSARATSVLHDLEERERSIRSVRNSSGLGSIAEDDNDRHSGRASAATRHSNAGGKGAFISSAPVVSQMTSQQLTVERLTLRLRSVEWRLEMMESDLRHMRTRITRKSGTAAPSTSDHVMLNDLSQTRSKQTGAAVMLNMIGSLFSGRRSQMETDTTQDASHETVPPRAAHRHRSFDQASRSPRGSTDPLMHRSRAHEASLFYSDKNPTGILSPRSSSKRERANERVSI